MLVGFGLGSSVGLAVGLGSTEGEGEGLGEGLGVGSAVSDAVGCGVVGSAVGEGEPVGDGDSNAVGSSVRRSTTARLPRTSSTTAATQMNHSVRTRTPVEAETRVCHGLAGFPDICPDCPIRARSPSHRLPYAGSGAPVWAFTLSQGLANPTKDISWCDQWSIGANR